MYKRQVPKFYFQKSKIIKLLKECFPVFLATILSVYLSLSLIHIFKENSSILEVGGNLGEITGVLCKKANKVVTLENQPDKATIISKRYENQDNLAIILGEWEDITLTEKFDYITPVSYTHLVFLTTFLIS